MTTYSTQPPAGGVRNDPFPAPPAIPVRPARKPGLVGAGIALFAIGALAAGMAVKQAGTKTQVLAVTHPLRYGQQITAGDLTVAHIAADPALSPIAAGDESQIIGRYVGTDVPAGSLLTRGDLSDGAIPGPGRVLLGIAVKTTALPAGGVHPADHVTVISTPGPNDDPRTAAAAAQSIRATVVSVGAADTDGVVVISVEAAASDAPDLAAWGATGRAAVVVEPRG